MEDPQIFFGAGGGVWPQQKNQKVFLMPRTYINVVFMRKSDTDKLIVSVA